MIEFEKNVKKNKLQIHEEICKKMMANRYSHPNVLSRHQRTNSEMKSNEQKEMFSEIKRTLVNSP